MRFFTLTAFTSLCALVAAAPKTDVPAAVPSATGVPALSSGTNPISYPLGEDAIQAGKTITIKWTPTYGSTVNLNLRKGNDILDLGLEGKIANGIPNAGSYTWTVPSSLDGTTYAIEIVAGNAANYSPQFEVNSTGKKGDAKPEPSSAAVVKPATVQTASRNSTASATASKSADASKATSSAPSKTATGLPSGAPTAPTAPDSDSGSDRTQGSVFAVMAGLMAAVALLN